MGNCNERKRTTVNKNDKKTINDSIIKATITQKTTQNCERPEMRPQFEKLLYWQTGGCNDNKIGVIKTRNPNKIEVEQGNYNKNKKRQQKRNDMKREKPQRTEKHG